MSKHCEILEIEGLHVSFQDGHSSVTALRDVGFTIQKGKTLALVGESGSGKSVTSLAIMGLLPNNARIESRRMRFYPVADGDALDLDRLKPKTMRELRGRRIAMIFQEPMSSLNPLYSIGDQIGEMLLLHEGLDASARKNRVIEILELVEIPSAAQRYNAWPHEFSGGMRQRVMIALALVCKPSLLIADEPTTALDVTIQAQILDLMRRLQSELEMSILFITHDMGVVAEMADDVAVMYAGQIVERTDTRKLFSAPRHPYTQGLLASIPRHGRARNQRIVPIPGSVPSLRAMPPGCSFAPRCSFSETQCRVESIDLLEPAHGHLSRCIRMDKVPANG
ncbi:MAG: ABC transporter ATP-binding protein [Hyphomicrobiales bacterium]|nr:ABC transporter ATP-binding protein [Hyphomicrobiales bacterium]